MTIEQCMISSTKGAQTSSLIRVSGADWDKSSVYYSACIFSSHIFEKIDNAHREIFSAILIITRDSAHNFEHGLLYPISGKLQKVKSF